MEAIQFDAVIPSYAIGKLLGRVYPPILWSRLSCFQYRQTPEPRLPNEEWVKIKTRYGGICGSDIHLLRLEGSPAASVLTSFPFTVGHENFGTIAETGAGVSGLSIGDRVIAEPTLWCKPRGFTDLCGACARGDIQLCERVTQGVVSPGPILGACRDTGGSWGPFFVAHESQLLRIPDEMSDENALLLEPFATSLHAILVHPPRDTDTVLVLGAGVIGLTMVAGLRAIGSRARIIVLARYPAQQELARHYGADVVIPAGRGYDYAAEFARAVGGKLLKPILGKRVLVGGGADVVYECVGSGDTIDDALRFARPKGRVVLVGLASLPKGVDWTPIWMKELEVKGSYTYGYDEFAGKRCRTYDLALELVSKQKIDLKPLITHKFPLDQYGRAFATIGNRGRAQALKVVFEF